MKTKQESKGRPLPAYLIKPVNDLTLKEALQLIRDLQRQISQIDKGLVRAMKALDDIAP